MFSRTMVAALAPAKNKLPEAATFGLEPQPHMKETSANSGKSLSLTIVSIGEEPFLYNMGVYPRFSII